MSEGYLILATGHPRYLEMARNLAASLRVMDGTRRICIVLDGAGTLQGGDGALFDDVARLEDDARYPGFMKKIQLYGLTPYQHSMFVDADCLLVKRDADLRWDEARSVPFAITGGRSTSGDWKGADVAALLRQEGAPYLVQMNSGVFCFDQSPQARQFFEGVNDFYLRRREHLGVGLHRGVPTQTDEIYIGLWMGMSGMDAVPGPAGDDSWMVSTWRAFWISIDPVRGTAVLRKPRHAFAGVPHPFRGWDRKSPSFLHFIGLRPTRTYRRLAAFFRAEAARTSLAASAAPSTMG